MDGCKLIIEIMVCDTSPGSRTLEKMSEYIKSYISLMASLHSVSVSPCMSWQIQLLTLHSNQQAQRSSSRGSVALV